MDIWTKALDDDKQIDIIYMDLQKAFDNVPHQRILIKSHIYGIQSEIIDWIEGFLLNRVQKVVVNGKDSVNHKKPLASRRDLFSGHYPLRST